MTRLSWNMRWKTWIDENKDSWKTTLKQQKQDHKPHKQWYDNVNTKNMQEGNN